MRPSSLFANTVQMFITLNEPITCGEPGRGGVRSVRKTPRLESQSVNWKQNSQHLHLEPYGEIITAEKVKHILLADAHNFQVVAGHPLDILAIKCYNSLFGGRR
jgi:hypothetical protein